MKNLLEVFVEGYDETKKELGHNEVKIGVKAGMEKEKIFTEKDFYYCGFSYILWKERGSLAPKENKGLSKLLEGEGYKVGKTEYYYNFKSTHQTLRLSHGNRGNGDHELQVGGYHKVADYLESLGYIVKVFSRLD